ncbi:MAG: DNA-binding protein [Burkholderiaceae bacterium]|nr:DNA-binding protein [Burkholderiaceae bacterium]
MTLQNLAKIGQLKPHDATPAEIRRLLDAAGRNLADAAHAGLSNETRFDCAYKAIMQCALIAMLANGYRPSTNAPGHHQTMIQSLPLTLGIGNDRWIVLDALRKKRNQSDYTGAPMSEVEAKQALHEARALLGEVETFLRRQRPELLKWTSAGS